MVVNLILLLEVEKELKAGNKKEYEVKAIVNSMMYGKKIVNTKKW